MITLLASITGFISSIIPEILKILKDQNDKKHALNLLDRQIEINKLGHTKLLTELDASKDIAENNTLYSTYKSGVNWVDALNGSVSPVLAYSFFIMYAYIKYVQYRTIQSTAILVEYLDVLWNIDDQAIFAGIISFYFGQRMFNKLWKRKM
ncbi:hypothetical protein [Candidatus Tisiphia endosymbiont of Myopa tessellatipennis]|uniref:hypothetical protein n=1 Tax=Candidatus Tisiphia endosymbiont of Myopa tessellatipennis TaxID=3066257 RepID=UPI00313C3BEE